jgi:hypothetical protein
MRNVGNICDKCRSRRRESINSEVFECTHPNSDYYKAPVDEEDIKDCECFDNICGGD